MSSLTLYFLRHGQTPFSRDNIFCGAGLDPELTVHGHEMARLFAKGYRALPWAAVYCSPLTRTRQTAAPLCAALGTEPEIRDELKEIAYGAWEGLELERIAREFHDDYLRWTADPAWNAPTGGGETAVTIASRAMRTVEEIRARHAASGGNVLVVSHKATIRILLCTLLGIDVGRFRYRLGCPVGSVSVVEFGRHGPLVQALADRTHLTAELRGLAGS